MRKQIAAANWKMNLTLEQGQKLINDIFCIPISLKDGQLAVFGLPFPYLIPIKDKLYGKEHVSVSAQNCSDKSFIFVRSNRNADLFKSLHQSGLRDSIKLYFNNTCI